MTGSVLSVTDENTFDDFDEDVDDSVAVEAYKAELHEAAEAFGVPVPDVPDTLPEIDYVPGRTTGQTVEFPHA